MSLSGKAERVCIDTFADRAAAKEIVDVINGAGYTAAAATAAANTSYFRQAVTPTGAVTIPTGTAPIVATVKIDEPNITATGTVTAAATLYISGAPTEGSANYGLWVAANARIDGDVNLANAAVDILMKPNTAAALEISDGTTKVAAYDTRNTIANVNNVTFTGCAPTIASAAAVHENATVKIADKTVTYSGTTTVTSSLGAGLNVGVMTFTDASVCTITTVSAVHINAIAAAGGSLTITNSRMISTSVSGAFLTNAGVWTDMACWASGKRYIGHGAGKVRAAIEDMMESILPATWKYRKIAEYPGVDAKGEPTVHRTLINDYGRQRVGIVYDELPEGLRAPGEKDAVAPGVLASFALAAIKILWEENRDMKERLEAAGL